MPDESSIKVQSTQTIRVAQLTDTHISADPDARFDGLDTFASMRAVLEHIVRGAATDLLLITGDLTDEPDASAYRRFARNLATLDLPVFCLPGNHDDPVIMARELSDARVATATGKVITAGRWRVIMLDTWVAGSHAGHLSTAELDFLSRQLQACADHPVLIALHHPPVPVHSPWMDAMGLRNSEDFFAVIDNFPEVRAVIWGHIHQEFCDYRNDVLLLGSPSSCIQFKPGADRYERDDRQPGYRELLLYPDGRLDSRVIRIETPGNMA